MSEKSRECEKDESRFSHIVFKNDPVLFKSYVNKRISVKTEDGTIQSGIVYTVDPVSESIILLESKENEKYDLKMILGHAIKSIQVLQDPVTMIPELFKVSEVSNDVCKKRKEAVKKLLSEKHFPVQEENEILCIEDSLRIEPPYYPENCVSTNSIILSRIQKIISEVTC